MAKQTGLTLAQEGTTQMRILVATTINGVAVPCGRVAKVDAKTAASLMEGGIADPSKEGVEYALGENPEIIDACPPTAVAASETEETNQ
jgi:hypothetical protein